MSSTKREPVDAGDPFGDYSEDHYEIPPGVIQRAEADERAGIWVRVSPMDLISAMTTADDALNSDSNDAEDDALCHLRDVLSLWFEDESRRTGTHATNSTSGD
jgi:hypothetical protein